MILSRLRSTTLATPESNMAALSSVSSPTGAHKRFSCLLGVNYFTSEATQPC